MTIKQNGGIFGRNPTFNDVEIQGTLTTSGSVSQSGNFTVDTNTFVVDATNDRVGVNIALPTQALHVNGNIILNDGSFGPGDSHSVAIGDLNAFIKSTHGSPIAFGAYHGYTFNFASAGDLTTNGEWARIDNDGLKFNGDTAAANALSDYEEGNWSPTGNGITFSFASGTYTKVGRVVHVIGQVAWPTTSDSNAANINGLPFTASSQGTGHIGLNNIGGAEYYFLTFNGGTAIRLYNSSIGNVLNSALSGKSLYITATYFV